VLPAETADEAEDNDDSDSNADSDDEWKTWRKKYNMMTVWKEVK
jgi:hypothetical protein